MSYTQDRVTVPIASAAAPEGVWFGALRIETSKSWEVRGIGEKKYSTGFNTQFFPDSVKSNGPFGCITRDREETTNTDIARMLSAIMLCDRDTMTALKSSVGLLPFSVIRDAGAATTRNKVAESVVLAGPWAPLLSRMGYDAQPLPVTWVFVSCPHPHRHPGEIVFDFVSWTYEDVATQCPIAMVYEDDLGPCVSCSKNGLVCKTENVASLIAARNHRVPPAVMQKTLELVNTQKTHVWLSLFQRFYKRVPKEASHLKDVWLGPAAHMAVHTRVNPGEWSRVVINGQFAVLRRKNKLEASKKATITKEKQNTMCDTCVLRGNCSAYKHATSCASFRTLPDVLEYVVHNDNMSPHDALASVLVTTFSTLSSNSSVAIPLPGKQLYRNVMLDGMDSGGRWCVRVVSDTAKPTAPMVGDNVSQRFSSYEEMCLWLAATHPSLWKDYVEFLHGTVAAKIKKLFTYRSAANVMTSSRRGSKYSHQYGPSVAVRFGDSIRDPSHLHIDSGCDVVTGWLGDVWYSSLRHIEAPYERGVELPAGATAVSFTA